SGIFFEFVPSSEIFNENPTRLKLSEVKTGENYAVILTTNAGLWSYNIGDTVKFVSTSPYRVIVTGRIKHYISAFGEHVIGEEVDYSLIKAAEETGAQIVEFTVAPMINSEDGKSYHEWFVEFGELPQNLNVLAEKVDKNLQEKNIYYKDLITGSILAPLKITPVRRSEERR